MTSKKRTWKTLVITGLVVWVAAWMVRWWSWLQRAREAEMNHLMDALDKQWPVSTVAGPGHSGGPIQSLVPVFVTKQFFLKPCSIWIAASQDALLIMLHASLLAAWHFSVIKIHRLIFPGNLISCNDPYSSHGESARETPPFYWPLLNGLCNLYHYMGCEVENKATCHSLISIPGILFWFRNVWGVIYHHWEQSHSILSGTALQEIEGCY